MSLNFDAKLTLDVSQFIASVNKAESAITRLEGRIRSINGTKMQGMKGQATNQATMNLSIAPALGQLTRLENKVKQTVAFINAQKPTLRMNTAEGNIVKQRQQEAQNAKNAEDATKREDAARNAHVRTLARERYALYDVAATYQMASRALLGFTSATMKGAAEYERAFVNVQRTTEFVAIKDRFDSLNEAARVMKYSFMQLATQIPLTFKDITEIATIGNQLGIAQGKLKDFTQTTAQFAATTDVTTSNAALSFGRIGELLSGKGEDVNYNKLGSAIAYAGVKAVATEAQILSVTKEISTTAKMAKFTAPEVVGLATALSSVGVAPEAARGSIIRSFALINNAITVGGDKLKGYADIAGMSSEQFAKTWQKNGQQAFGAFLSGLQNLSNSGQNLDSVLRNLGIKNVRDIQTIQKLGDNYNVYADSIANANKAYSDGTFLAESYGKIQDTLATKLDLMKNNMDNLMATLGNGFTGDIFKGVIDGINQFLKGLTDAARSPFGQWVAGTAIALAGLLGAVAAINGAVALGRASMLAFATAMDVTKVSADGATVSIDKAALATKVFNTALKASIWMAAISLIIVGIEKIAEAFTPVEQKAESILGGFTGLQDAFTADTKALEANAAAAGMTAEAYAAANGILLIHTDALAGNDQAARDAQAAHDGLNFILGNEPDSFQAATGAIEGQTIAIGTNTIAWLKNAMAQSSAFQDMAKNQNFVSMLASSGYNFDDAFKAAIGGADKLNTYLDNLQKKVAGDNSTFLGQFLNNASAPLLSNGWQTLKDTLAGTANEILLLGLGADKATTPTEKLTNTTKNLTKELKAAGGSIKEVIRTVVDYASDLASAFKRVDDIRFGRRTALDNIAAGWKTLSERIHSARNAMIAAKQTIDSLTADRRVLEYQLGIAQKYGDVLRAAEIQAQLAKNTQDAADAQANYNKAKVDSTTATTGAAGAQNRSSFMGLLQQYQGYITALAAAGVKGYALQRAIAPLKADFRDQATALGFSTDQVDKFVSSFDDYKNVVKFLPRDVTVEFKPKKSAAFNALEEYLAKEHKLDVKVVITNDGVLNTVGGTNRLTYIPGATTSNTGAGTSGAGTSGNPSGHSAGYGARLAKRNYLKAQGISKNEINYLMDQPSLVAKALTPGLMGPQLLSNKAAEAAVRFDETRFLLGKKYSRKDIAWLFNTYLTANGRRKPALLKAATSEQRQIITEDENYHATLGYANGGAVSGRGGNRSDSILARLSNGEFVMQASSVKSYGVDFMNALNRQQIPVTRQAFAGGSAGGGVGSQIVYLSPEDRSLLRAAIDRPVNLYTENTKIAQSANAGNVLLAQRGVN